MTGSERDAYVEERAYRILKDDHAAAAYAAFVDDQLRYRRMRHLLAMLRALARVAMVVMLAILSACIVFSPVLSSLPAESAVRRSDQRADP